MFNAKARHMRKLLAQAIMVLGALAAGLPWEAEAQSIRSGDTVTGQASVVDGNHLDIKSNRFRIWGIDTPERGASCYRNTKRWKPAQDSTAALVRCVQTKMGL